MPRVSGGRRAPWRIRVDDGALLVSAHALPDRDLHQGTTRELAMLIGAAIENLRIALHSRGRACSIGLFPDPGDVSVIAAIRPSGVMRLHTEDKVLQSLLPPRAHPRAVHHRTGLLSPALLAVYRHAVRCTGAWLDIVTDDRRRNLLGDLACEAEADRGLGCKYLHSAARTERRDHGAEPVPGFDASSLPELLGSLGGRVRSRVEAHERPAGSLRERIVDAPLLCIIATPGDGVANWIMAGRAIQRLLLHAAAQTMSATIFDAPLHRPVLRDAVKSLLVADGTPQMILRLDFDELEAGTAQPMASAAYQ
jgi:hypothetical protein